MVPNPATQPAIQLPDIIVSPTDINRLMREIDNLSEYVKQASIRHPGVKVRPPQASYLLGEFGLTNKLSWLTYEDCQQATAFFATLKKDAPIVHISFAVDPSAAFMTKLVVWFRHNIHPLTLISIGLQPNIAAGCIVRTTNHVFDFSLRRRFSSSRQLLIDRLQEWS
jgi:hypothetical protein